MEYRNIGSSGLQVSVVGLGCNNFGRRLDAEATRGVVSRCLDVGINFIYPMEVAAGIEPITQLGPFQYRLAGDLAIHDWADVLGIDLEETRLTTIGGLVTALLGKMPRQGDVAHLGNLKFTVERVHRHRIETVILSLEPLQSNGG